MTQSVIPLESNPEIFTEFAHSLGLVPLLSFHDVYSVTDIEVLEFLPQPIYAFVLLFPITDSFEQFRQQEAASTPESDGGVVWLKQSVKNACGLYALLHVLLNVPKSLVVKDSKADNFRRKIQNNLKQADLDELVEDCCSIHESYATQGSTEAPDAEDDVNLHFVTFVAKNGRVYELDGRRTKPVDVGSFDSNDKFGKEKVIFERVQYYMELTQDPNFALIALASTG
ncbi:unnamed protein product [Kuraishia capsulata CBS 1993]|uniref:Ubiquitin carboxyl-terminal hydrolase n=1 Tax=Kuraishia capsulata CBS 1993 TaxID=1382522 RepID=W6MJ80_9ASCO|nr:uncharacterized protein KUCA_T00000450001 [Kuraishia capsulata CBS 1993]CDK24487.1 unnamed protein product [Kuraishia capsulata CBS 1993]